MLENQTTELNRYRAKIDGDGFENHGKKKVKRNVEGKNLSWTKTLKKLYSCITLTKNLLCNLLCNNFFRIKTKLGINNK